MAIVIRTHWGHGHEESLIHRKKHRMALLRCSCSPLARNHVAVTGPRMLLFQPSTADKEKSRTYNDNTFDRWITKIYHLRASPVRSTSVYLHTPTLWRSRQNRTNANGTHRCGSSRYHPARCEPRPRHLYRLGGLLCSQGFLGRFLGRGGF